MGEEVRVGTYRTEPLWIGAPNGTERTHPLFRWNRRPLRLSKGDADDSVTVTNQAGRICRGSGRGSGLVSPIILSIILLCVLFIFHERRYRTGISMNTMALRRRNHMDSYSSTANNLHAIRNKGGIQSKWNIIIIQTSETTTKHRDRIRCGYFFTTTTILWQYSNVGNLFIMSA